MQASQVLPLRPCAESAVSNDTARETLSLVLNMQSGSTVSLVEQSNEKGTLLAHEVVLIEWFSHSSLCLRVCEQLHSSMVRDRLAHGSCCDLFDVKTFLRVYNPDFHSFEILFYDRGILQLGGRDFSKILLWSRGAPKKSLFGPGYSSDNSGDGPHMTVKSQVDKLNNTATRGGKNGTVEYGPPKFCRDYFDFNTKKVVDGCKRPNCKFSHSVWAAVTAGIISDPQCKHAVKPVVEVVETEKPVKEVKVEKEEIKPFRLVTLYYKCEAFRAKPWTYYLFGV